MQPTQHPCPTRHAKLDAEETSLAEVSSPTGSPAIAATRMGSAWCCSAMNGMKLKDP